MFKKICFITFAIIFFSQSCRSNNEIHDFTEEENLNFNNNRYKKNSHFKNFSNTIQEHSNVSFQNKEKIKNVVNFVKSNEDHLENKNQNFSNSLLYNEKNAGINKTTKKINNAWIEYNSKKRDEEKKFKEEKEIIPAQSKSNHKTINLNIDLNHLENKKNKNKDNEINFPIIFDNENNRFNYDKENTSSKNEKISSNFIKNNKEKDINNFSNIIINGKINDIDKNKNIKNLQDNFSKEKITSTQPNINFKDQNLVNIVNNSGEDFNVLHNKMIKINELKKDTTLEQSINKNINPQSDNSKDIEKKDPNKQEIKKKDKEEESTINKHNFVRNKNKNTHNLLNIIDKNIVDDSEYENLYFTKKRKMGRCFDILFRNKDEKYKKKKLCPPGYFKKKIYRYIDKENPKNALWQKFLAYIFKKPEYLYKTGDSYEVKNLYGVKV